MLAYLPRADGVFLTDNLQQLVVDGKVAKIPVVTGMESLRAAFLCFVLLMRRIGDCDDEGTLFTLSTLNLTTDAAVEKYVKEIWLSRVPEDELEELFDLYPSYLPSGSPYNTGFLNALSPQSKRIASFQGDAVFQSARRLFLDNISGKQDTWSFCMCFPCIAEPTY